MPPKPRASAAWLLWLPPKIRLFMQDQYQPQAIEQAAQAHWAAHHVYQVTERADKPKYYACSMLPYPSG